MAITNSKQKWQTGETVKIGFMTLEVVAFIPTPGDYMPDAYRLWNPANGKKYTFTPHYGIESDWTV